MWGAEFMKFESALYLKMKADGDLDAADDYQGGQYYKREEYCNVYSYPPLPRMMPRKYCSGRGKLEGWFYGQFTETLGAWEMFCLFEAAPNATHTVPLSLERGNVFLLPGSSEHLQCWLRSW